MPLVFIHGVNTREGSTAKDRTAFKNRIKVRNDLFRTIGLAGLVSNPDSLHIENPYWGGHGANFTHDLASVPGSSTEFFGSTGEDVMTQVIMETVSTASAAELANRADIETTLLITMARQNPQAMLPLVVDLLIAAAASQPMEGANALADNADLTRFAAAATAYLNPPISSPQPNLDWLFAKHPVTGQALRTDDQFLEAFKRQVDR
jgi:hypothetical protein